MKRALTKIIPFLVMASFLATGCTQENTQAAKAAKPAVEQVAKENVYKGSVVGKSNKAKTISIKVGKGEDAKTIMVAFDDQTKGVEHASVGHASIINYEMRNGKPYATVIKPKLAKLPEGVAEIKTDALVDLMASGKQFTLIDSRPGGRFAAGSLPGAKNITVPKMKETMGAGTLPENKDELVVFFCGGPT